MLLVCKGTAQSAGLAHSRHRAGRARHLVARLPRLLRSLVQRAAKPTALRALRLIATDHEKAPAATSLKGTRRRRAALVATLFPEHTVEVARDFAKTWADTARAERHGATKASLNTRRTSTCSR